jgi:hypothetical protein
MIVSQCVEPTIIPYDVDGPPIYDLYLAEAISFTQFSPYLEEVLVLCIFSALGS